MSDNTFQRAVLGGATVGLGYLLWRQLNAPTSTSSARATLTYWNGRGRAEVVRLMLAATGEDYDEAVPGFPGATHLTKPEQFEQLKENGLLAFGQVPLLRIDGLDLVQTGAIVRYLAAKHSLRGDGSAADVARCDMTAETVLDWKNATCPAFEFALNGFEPSKEQLEKLQAGNARYMPRLEKALERNGTGWFVGGRLSYPDVLAFEVLEQIAPHCDMAPFPRLSQLHQALLQNARIKAWLASDKRKMKTQDGLKGYKADVNRTLRR